MLNRRDFFVSEQQLLSIHFIAMGIFTRERGETVVQPYKKDASVAIAAGDPVMLASGVLVKADETATPATLVGVMMEDVTSDDADYAEETFKNVDVGNLNDEFRAEVGTGTATASMVGGRYDLDSDGKVDVTASTNDVVEIVRFIDAATVVVKFVAN